MRVYIETLGCRLNQTESEGMSQFFFDAGFSVLQGAVSAKSEADFETEFCVLNTCAVTTKAEQKARRTIRLLLKKFPNAILIVTGCYAQLSQKEISRIDRRVFVLPGLLKSRVAEIVRPPEIEKKGVLGEAGFWKRRGVQNGGRLSGEAGGEKKSGCVFKKCCSNDFFRILKNACGTENASSKKENFLKSFFLCDSDFFAGGGMDAADSSAAFFPFEPFRFFAKTFFNHSRASLKIQDGCKNRCSYCSICLARGKSVSLLAEEVLERARALERAGHSEVVLTGVNIGQYESELFGKKIFLAGLLEEILLGTKKIAIRLSSVHPQAVTEEFCRAIQNPRVRPHFHLSLQSGSDAILKKMNRPYTRADVERACVLLRRAKKNPFLACDVIAGFPSESEEDFSKTISLLSRCDFSGVHAFAFSPRKNTFAFGLRPKIAERVKDERVAVLRKFSAEQKIKYVEKFCGKTLFAVFESGRKDFPFFSKKNPAKKNQSFFGKSGEPSCFQKDAIQSEGEFRFSKKTLRCVTENFIHAKVVLKKNCVLPKEGEERAVRILQVCKESIFCGGETEAVAELL